MIKIALNCGEKFYHCEGPIKETRSEWMDVYIPGAFIVSLFPTFLYGSDESMLMFTEGCKKFTS